MTSKGTITGNDAADRILREEVPCSEKALRRIVDSERLRTVASVRGKWDQRKMARASHMEDVWKVYAEMTMMLDEMERTVSEAISE